MKIQVTSQSGISFSVELTEEERKLIKEDLTANLIEIKSATTWTVTDLFLREIREIL